MASTSYKSQSADQALRDFETQYPDGNLVGNWVGKEKTRYDFVLKYISGRSTSRGYFVHSFQDRSGNRFLAFLDCETIMMPHGTSVEVNECFTCKATVNRHGINTFKYGKVDPFKETVLNRIKFKNWLGTPEGTKDSSGAKYYRNKDAPELIAAHYATGSSL